MNSGMYGVPKGPWAQLSSIHLYRNGGTGSTNTAILYFTTVATNVGTAIRYNRSSELGDSFVITEAGIYTINWAASTNSAINVGVGLSRNSTELTTAVGSIASVNRLGYGLIPSAGIMGAVTWTGLLFPNDVIRAHGDVAGDYRTNADLYGVFTISQLAASL